MSRLAYPGIRWDKMARLVLPWISQDNNFRLRYPGISLQRYSCNMFHSSPCLAASLQRQVSLLLFEPPLPPENRISNLWSWLCWYRRSSYGVNISAWSSSSAGRKPATIASATEGATAECLLRGVISIQLRPTSTCSSKALWHHQQSGGAYFCIFVILVCT